MPTKQELKQQAEATLAEHKRLLELIASMPEDTPSKWVPKHGDRIWVLDYTGAISMSIFGQYPIPSFRLSVGNVHHTKEDAERYRLRLESFVPALGPETPSDEVLATGWIIGCYPSGNPPIPVTCTGLLTTAAYYQDGSWHPTREAAEEWLAKYGVVRGYREGK